MRIEEFSSIAGTAYSLILPSGFLEARRNPEPFPLLIVQGTPTWRSAWPTSKSGDKDVCTGLANTKS